MPTLTVAFSVWEHPSASVDAGEPLREVLRRRQWVYLQGAWTLLLVRQPEARGRPN